MSDNIKKIEYPETGQIIYDEESDSLTTDRGARKATDEDLQRDEYGYTHPNLHRRIDPQQPDTNETGEVAPRDYRLEILGVNSYRTTTKHFHDDVCEGDVVHYREVAQEDGTKIRVPIEIP